MTELRTGFNRTAIKSFSDSDALHTNAKIRLRKTAGQVGTPTLTNIWLALELLGALSKSLVPSLYIYAAESHIST